MYNVFGFVLLSALALGATAAFGGRAGWYSRNLLLAAVGLRLLGSSLRYEILFRYYNGFGDAVRYYYEGLSLAEMIRSFAVNPLSLEFWTSGQKWWGTFFLIKSSGVVLAAIGPSLRGEFVVFSLISFLGVYLIARCVRRLQPGEPSERYTLWLWLWPSLWFWPSSVGKEAVLLFAIGLTCVGYVGRRESIGWLSFLGGMGLAFCIRPHVAAVLAFSAVAGHWLGSWRRLTLLRFFEAAVAFVIALAAFAAMSQQFGLGDADLEGVREFVAFRQGQTEVGGSEIGGVSLSPAGFSMALINAWVRPFPWDVHNMTSAFAAAEILILWWLAWKRRRALVVAIKHWRRHRLLRFGVPFLFVYSLMIGLTFANLGIIARQRTPILPFMLLVLLAAPEPASTARRHSTPRLQVPPTGSGRMSAGSRPHQS